MKKTTYVMLMLLTTMTLLLASCSSKLDQVKQMVTQTQKELPLDLGMAGKITSFIYDEEKSEVVATVKVSSTIADLNMASMNEESIRKNLMLTMNLNKAFKQLLTMVADADLTFRFVYVVGEGKELNVAFTPSDVKNAEEIDGVTAAEMYLDNEVENAKTNLPMEVDEATTWIDFVKEKDCVVYVYQLDENIFSIELFEENNEMLKEQLGANVLRTKDPTFIAFKENCKTAGKGIKYRYIGNKSEKAVDVLFTAEEL